MRRDEKGVAMPGPSFNLPLSVDGGPGVPAHIRDVAGVTVAPVVYTLEMAEFIVHAANYHARLADIVRRLAKWHSEAVAPCGSLSFNLIKISQEANELWEEMTQEGGENEG